MITLNSLSKKYRAVQAEPAITHSLEKGGGWRMHWGDWVMPRPICPRDLDLDEELHSRVRQGIPRRFATAPPGLEASGLMTESAVKAFLDAFLEFGKILKLGEKQLRDSGAQVVEIADKVHALAGWKGSCLRGKVRSDHDDSGLQPRQGSACRYSPAQRKGPPSANG